MGFGYINSRGSRKLEALSYGREDIMLSQKQFTTFNDTARFLLKAHETKRDWINIMKIYLQATVQRKKKNMYKLNIQDTVFFKTWKNDLISSITELISIRFENILIPHI